MGGPTGVTVALSWGLKVFHVSKSPTATQAPPPCIKSLGHGARGVAPDGSEVPRALLPRNRECLVISLFQHKPTPREKSRNVCRLWEFDVWHWQNICHHLSITDRDILPISYVGKLRLREDTYLVLSYRKMRAGARTGASTL